MNSSVSLAVLGYAGAFAGAVVATALVSVNADYDNGTAVYHTLRASRYDGNVLHRVAREVPRGGVDGSTAFLWAHASWDNAERSVSRSAFRGVCGA